MSWWKTVSTDVLYSDDSWEKIKYFYQGFQLKLRPEKYFVCIKAMKFDAYILLTIIFSYFDYNKDYVNIMNGKDINMPNRSIPG